MPIADPERFTTKSKPITYTRTFVELYKWRNYGQIDQIHGIVEFDKWHVSTAKNPRNLGAHCIIKISSIMHSAHVVPRDQDMIIFYVINYIDWDQINQLYNAD